MSDESDRNKSVLSIRTRLAIKLGGWLVKTLGMTWRLRIHNEENVNACHASGTPVIFILWHGQMLACAYAHKWPTSVMISEHRDGEIITQIVKLFGLSAIRGSTSRGGARALLHAASVLRETRDVAVTPDGPRGPRHSFAPGALLLSFRGEAPMISVTTHVSRAWRFKSWDRFEVPKPFARIDLVYSAPVRVVAENMRDASAQAATFVKHMSDEAVRAAAFANAAAN